MALPSIKNSVGMAVTAVADSGEGTLTVGAALSGGYQTAGTAYGADANIDIRVEEGNNWEVCRDCAYDHSELTVTRGTQEDGSLGTSARVAFTTAAEVYVVESGHRIQDRLTSLVTAVPYGSAQSLTSGATNTLTTALNATATEDALGIWDGTNKRYNFNRKGVYLLTLGVRVSISSTKFILPTISATGCSVLSYFQTRGFPTITVDVDVACMALVRVTEDTGQYATLHCFNSDTAKNTAAANTSATWIGY